MNNNLKYDFLIIGAGIVGLSLAYKLKQVNQDYKILIIEKESEIGLHASGRNSGIVHAGFYYTANSLKARLCRSGNLSLKQFCRANNIYVAETEKLVVAKNESELESLHVLYNRGVANGVPVELISEDRAREVEPNIKTHKLALYSPSTASVNPKQVCNKLKEILLTMGVKISCGERFICLLADDTVKTNLGQIKFKQIVNSAGLYADKIANALGLKHDFIIVPFKGLYLKYNGDSDIIRTNIYPVPNLNNPFLGVHFTKMYNGDVKIGPTAIPAMWRENYGGFANFNAKEMLEVVKTEASMAINNRFNFAKLACSELRKYFPRYFISQARSLVVSIDNNFTTYPAGIRAQLFDLKNRDLVQDFVIQRNKNQIHILNSVSPSFTCAFSFADYVVNSYVTCVDYQIS